jgi:hypothetical protein
MNGSLLLPQIWRFIGLTAAQVLLFRQVGLTIGGDFQIFLYPLFILFLPKQMNTVATVLLGALIGLTVDFFYGAPGLHASAGAFSGISRGIVFYAFRPRGGYSGKEPIASPFHFGWEWFVKVSLFFFFLHIFWYFSVDAFAFTTELVLSVTKKTLIATFLSMLFVLFYGFLFNPKQ